MDDEKLLVRINACNLLSIGILENTVTALCRKARQDHYLVRGYVLMSLADVVQNRSDAPKSRLPFLKKAYLELIGPFICCKKAGLQIAGTECITIREHVAIKEPAADQRGHGATPNTPSGRGGQSASILLMS